MGDDPIGWYPGFAAGDAAGGSSPSTDFRSLKNGGAGTRVGGALASPSKKLIQPAYCDHEPVPSRSSKNGVRAHAGPGPSVERQPAVGSTLGREATTSRSIVRAAFSSLLA
jgi:hypothetical protein